MLNRKHTQRGFHRCQLKKNDQPSPRFDARRASKPERMVFFSPRSKDWIVFFMVKGGPEHSFINTRNEAEEAPQSHPPGRGAKLVILDT